MAITKNDEKTLAELFANAFREVVIPVLEDLEKRLTDKLASKEAVDRIERKLDAHQDRMDRHDKGIQTLEERASL